VLVTGATGFVGRYIVEQLSTTGFDPVPVYRDGAKFEKIFPSFAGESLKWDLEHPASTAVAKSVGSCDVVVHASADLHGGTDGDRAVLHGNLLQLLHLIAVIPESCKQIVFLSSTAVYGTVEEASESLHPSPSNVYGVAKLGSERLLDLFAQETELNVAKLRISSVYGPGMPENRAIPKFIESLFSTDPVTLTPGAFEPANYLYVRDVASAVVKCMNGTRPINGTYNIAAASDQSLSEILDMLELLTGMTANREVSDTDSTPRNMPLHVTTDHARLSLGFDQPTSIRVGLQEMITDLKSERQ